MALKGYEGFDHYGGSGVNSQLFLKRGFVVYTWSNNSYNQLSFVTGRISGQALSMGGNNYDHWVRGSFSSSFVTLFMGQAVYLTNSNSNLKLSFHNSQTSNAHDGQFYLVFNTTNFSIQVYRGDPANSGSAVLIGQTANNVFSLSSWFYVEVGFSIGTSAGTCGLKINGSAVLNLLNINNQGTSDETTVDSFKWWANGFYVNNGYTLIDDVYWCDNTTGPGTYPCNSYLGDSRVLTGFPSANASVAFTPLANSNWQEVSEVQMDSDTSYNYSSSAGATDLFTWSGLPANVTTIFGVQITGAYRQDDAGSHVMTQEIKSSTTSSNGTGLSLSTSFVFTSDLWVTDPNTSASWLTSAVSSLQFGYTLTS